MRRRMDAHRRDANGTAVIAALRAAGWYVHDASQVGRGFPDLVCAKGGRMVLVEVKDGAKVPSARKLTPEETRVHEKFAAAGVPIVIVESVEEAVQL